MGIVGVFTALGLALKGRG